MKLENSLGVLVMNFREWKEWKLSDFIEFNPKESIKKGSIAKKISMDKIEPFCKAISNFEISNFKGGSKFRNGDTLLARITPCLENGKTSKVSILDENEVAFGSTEFIVSRAKSDISDSDFIYYFLTSEIFRKRAIQSMVGSSGRQRVQLGLISDTIFSFPDIKEQIRIAKVLSSIDEKIELNSKINKTLEETAKAIFKSWFVDFTPFKEGEFVDSVFGLIPNDFKIVQLGDIADCVLGGTPSKSKKEYWDGNIPWINSGKVNDFRITKPSQTISKLGLEKSATKLLPKDTVVLAITGATLGQVSLLAIETCTNQSVVGIIQNNIIRYSYIYPTILFRIIEIINMQTGGAQQHINKGNIENFPILLPNKDIMNCYHQLVDPIYQMINQNCLMNDNLTEIRDSLLSKLMSGEIRVPIEEVPNEEIR